MDFERRGPRQSTEQDSVFSRKMKAGTRRTYFFDVKQTKGDDYYIVLTENTKQMDGYGAKKHKIFLYKEDLNRFVSTLEEVVNHVKTELMPNYDYDEFTRRHEDYELSQTKTQHEESTGDAPSGEEEIKW